MIFTPIKVGCITLKNRFVMAPVALNYGTDEHTPSKKYIEYYLERAKGGIGLIITEGTLLEKIDLKIIGSRKPTGIYNNTFVEPFRNMVRQVHALNIPIFMQLVHTLGYRTPMDLSFQEICGLKDKFVHAAKRAQNAGFDGVEFHMAHYSTLAGFLSMKKNKRTDKYGGTLDKRLRLPVEIVEKSRKIVGNHFVIACRITGDEFIVEGNTLKQSQVIAKSLVNAGADLIDVSAGGVIGENGTKTYSYIRAYPPAYFPDAPNAHLAEEIKKILSVPVVTAGKISSPQVAEEIIQKNKADLIALGRALVADPKFPRKAECKDFEEIVYCTYCNVCRKQVDEGRPVRCPLWQSR